MIQESEGETVSFTQFITEYKRGGKILYCFFEGQPDLLYYNHRIETSLPTFTYIEFTCGGKEKVIKTYQLIKGHNEYKKGKCAYFVDKDYDRTLNNSDIFETSVYSIENYYCSNETFSKILVTIFGMRSYSLDYDNCMNLYINLKQQFIVKIKLLHCWAKCIAKKRSEGDKIRVNYDTVLEQHFRQVVKADLSEIKAMEEIQSLESIEKLFQRQGLINSNYFSSVCKCEPTERNIRGKFMISFLNSFLGCLQSDLNRPTPIRASKTY